ncbi:MAG: DUF4367 domain-containing protein [Defluviitaleaceae bacterium]|nr:DUF4367 domain-containing protein [Defluviitaleaceae bacterium]
MSDRDRNEKIFEAMLKIAAEEALMREMDALPSLEELNEMYPRSKEFDKRIMKMINRHYRAEKIKIAAKIFARIAAVVCIFFTVSVMVLMNVEASRIFILNTVISMQDNYVSFNFSHTENDGQSLGFKSILEEHLPMGFRYEGSANLETVIIYMYANAEGENFVFQRHFANALGVGIADTNREFSFMENPGIYVFDSYTDGYENIIMWTDDNYVFKIYSSIDIDTLINIARSMVAR